MLGNRLVTWVYQKCEIIMHLAYLNLLWVAFTILGLGIFGVMPATTAVFAVTRRWALGKTDTPIFQTFWNVYRTEFFKSQLIGILLFGIGLVFYTDFKFTLIQDGFVSNILFFILIVFLVLFLSTFLFFFPIYVHYKSSWSEYIKNAFIFGITHPVYVASMFGGVIIITIIIYFSQALLFFFLISSIAYWTTWIAHKAFLKIEVGKSNILENTI
jgi:uncharacterized membrane protein YesL